MKDFSLSEWLEIDEELVRHPSCVGEAIPERMLEMLNRQRRLTPTAELYIERVDESPIHYFADEKSDIDVRKICELLLLLCRDQYQILHEI